MKNRIWIIVFSSLALICVVCWLCISNSTSQSQIVGIYQNGDLVEKIDLNCITSQREMTLSGDYGNNTILISHRHIEMKSADCPDKLCVEHGELKSLGSPIVCLPNRVVIKFEDTSYGTDVKTGDIV